jgi:shikimate dehydrogenase
MINYLVNPCQQAQLADEVILDEVTSEQNAAGRVSMNVQKPLSCLIGLVGKGILRSKSPALHQQEADALGIRCLYQLIDLNVVKLDLEDLPQVIASAELMGFAGLNITHPCKQAVIPLLHELSEDARTIGAVNTVRFARGKRIGYNTDAQGFAESFTRGLPDVPLTRVVQLGAGGAGAATAYALLKMGVARLEVFDVDTNRAAALVTKLAASFGDGRVRIAAELPAAVAAADGLVQASPIGTREHPGMPLAEGLLRSALWVAEIVYFPLETQLLRTARALGCRTLSGGGMAVFQAAAAFEIFTGHKADGDRMMRHFPSIPGD